ncbi:TnpV protein [Clostridium kluyveri]|uniref:Uncharacterized protein n=1 Tax=Clostridium kluyveri (strain ATCC 8527 / DSM 555 / NBRC 12016 / NCIMB 10680 / K1) TaxID=431943 RepID=A5N1A8_CLOK5|nr:TnpV protein [Clostridium kluyveri]EDK34904.1 Hypothetical protein CKL_2892 [Clostridium kluyveri DSM 555]
MLYPNIEIDGEDKLKDLGKHSLLRLNYLHEQRSQMYRKLLLTGKLAQHCTAIDKTAFDMAEQVRSDYLKSPSTDG